MKSVTKERIRGRMEEAESKWMSQQDSVKLQQKEVTRLRNEMSVKQQAYLKALQQNNQWETEIKQVEVRLENLTDHQKQLESSLRSRRS